MDRAEVYADGASKGAPQATQIADRWHLLKNLSDSLDEILTRLYPELCQALTPDPTTAAAEPPDTGEDMLVTELDPIVLPPIPEPDSTLARAVAAGPTGEPQSTDMQQGRPPSWRTQRLAHYEEIQVRYQNGQSLSHIARQLGLDQRTVSKYARLPSFPEQQPIRRSSALDAHRKYLTERWSAGCHNKARLWRELQERGYSGGYRNLYDYVTTNFGKSESAASGQNGSTGALRVRRREWVHRLSQPAAELSAEAATAIAGLCARNESLARIYELVQRFGQLVREQARERFDAWLAAALASGVRELVSFARGLQRDYAAVGAALATPFSNGPTEGHVNKLKVVKRAMYGRAKFDLLRKRVLCGA